MTSQKPNQFMSMRVMSHHHRLPSDVFDIFQKGVSFLEISNVEDKSFILSYQEPGAVIGEKLFGKCHEVFSYFLVSINVATLGNFSWDLPFVSSYTPYIIMDKSKNSSEPLFYSPEQYKNVDPDMELTKALVWRALQLLLALTKENDNDFRNEYVKGLYNFHHRFLNIKFNNEAFSNFYRAFEFFCTRKMMRVKKLKNENKELRQVLLDFGFEEKIVSDFDVLYRIRCSEAMHSQKGLENVEIESIVRLKIFLDSIMHKYYQPLWEEQLKK